MTPLPFVWPYAAVFWGLHFWAFWPEFRIVRSARREATAQDAKSLRVITWGMWLAYMAAYPVAWLPAFQFRAHRGAVFFAGLVLITAGTLLRRHCWRMLGASFTGDVRATPGQAVVTRGAYAFLRHPSYTAGTMMNTGIGVALGSWLSALILLAVSLAVYSYRIAIEERALIAVLGAPYEEFLRSRKRLIPFVY